MTTRELIPGRSILLLWVAPFTLDVTNTEPDITYCVNVNVNVDQVTSRHINVICDITATSYNVTFNEGEVTPCDTVSVTVFPVNGPSNYITTGISESLNPIYLFKGTLN